MLRETAEALAVIAADAPLVLLLEDPHWSDPSTLDVIDHQLNLDTCADGNNQVRNQADFLKPSKLKDF